MDVLVEEQNITINGREGRQHATTEVKGVAVAKIKHIDLRAICGKLSVSGYKNKRKLEMTQLIAMKKLSEEVYDQLFAEHSRSKITSTAPKQIQCLFRLINILFSDRFAERFACFGDVPTREEIDKPGGKNETFWKDDRASFVGKADEHVGKLQCSTRASSFLTSGRS